MYEDEYVDPGTLVDEDTGEFAAVNAELQASLNRQLTVAVLEPPGGDLACTEMRARLATYPEVRVLAESPGERPDYHALKTLLAVVSQSDADALLVWTDAAALEAPAPGAHEGQSWPRQVLGAAEDINLLDNCFTVPIGPGVSRLAARKAGYEDGFAETTPISKLLRAITREALVREQYRRRGSSPPCYL
ncbi:MAG: hypothetical protein ACHQ4H_10470 [Ktedonobacterales bacterium]